MYDLKLTCNSFDKMSDTNKLLYLIYGELAQIREALMPSLLDQKGNAATDTSGASESKDVLRCKYCEEIVPGNRGNLLAHIRQCDKRKKVE